MNKSLLDKLKLKNGAVIILAVFVVIMLIQFSNQTASEQSEDSAKLKTADVSGQSAQSTKVKVDAAKVVSERSEAFNAGAEIVDKGRGDIPACKFCHGKKGQGDHHGGIPRLAGLHPEYIIKQLQDFARGPTTSAVTTGAASKSTSTGGSRTYSEMNRIAKLLTAEEKKQVAAYFSQLSFEAKNVLENDDNDDDDKKVALKEAITSGKKIVTTGIPDKGVPACTSCHGIQLEGFNQQFPPLAGQPASYILKQLDHWQHGTRNNDEGSIMRNIAKNLSDDDKKAIASYLATVPYRVNFENDVGHKMHAGVMEH